MSVFDKLHDLKDALVGEHGQPSSGEQGRKDKEHWSDKVRWVVGISCDVI